MARNNKTSGVDPDQNPDPPDPHVFGLFRGMDPDSDPSIIMQK